MFASKKILIVEDDKFLRDLVLKKLKEEQYDTVYAVDGEEAIGKIKEEKPDLVLLDLILPSLSGFEVLKQLKADPQPEVNAIPVIILSNLGQEDDIKKGLEMGAKDFLIKAHFTLSEIIAKIKEVLK